ncbi:MULTISPECIES: hypothetical protein [Emticicia]|uniref:hypothetical protein n=1 Tax=Emticicia TaxID=312278 RepID=UPI0007D8AB05|nr:MULTISPECIES: hypothetical protein [Emticicia]
MIPNSLNADLLIISQKLENRKQILRKLQEAKRVYVTEQKKLEATKQQMEDEFKDVKDLETLTLKSIWYNLLNKKFSELEREQAEYYQAKIQFESQQNKVDNLSLEIKSYEAQVFDLETIKIQYEGLIQEKVKLLKANNHPQLVDVFSKQEELVKIDAYKNEIQEAILAAENVLTIIPKAVKELKGAKDYATWDMIGGGTMATYLKRQKMNKAKLGIVEINYALDKLKRELKDLKPDLFPSEIKFNTSWEFADYFFDIIFVDMKIRERIVDAYNAILSLHKEIILLKEKLITEKKSQQVLYEERKRELMNLIEQA